MSKGKENHAGKIAKGDIVRLDFEGRIEDSNELFDTTNAQTAKDNGVFNEKIEYAPIPVLVGGGRVFQGLEEALEGAEVGKEVEVVIPADKAAGQRDPKLVELIPVREFLRQEVEPRIGMEINIKNRVGVVTAVTAGRVRVDFNRRLAGKSLKYVFTVISKAESDEDKIKAVVEMDYGSANDFKITKEEDVITLVLPDVCKYDQKWLLAKYRIVADLREAMKAGTVKFVEEYVKKDAEEAKAEAPSEEMSPEELPQDKE
jgi:FKBP-type peptidyl-prolyl cis-trans isomerase 2